jgi:hypothetical protein
MADTVAMATDDGAADAPGAAPSSVGAIPATPAPTTAQPISATSADPERGQQAPAARARLDALREVGAARAAAQAASRPKARTAS